jgi:Holliday junction resolvase RusA-like endonuclease
MKKKDEECGGPLDLDKTGLTPYDSRYTFYFPKSTLYTLDGRIRRRNDVSNCIKVVEDAVMKYLDSNDGFVMDMKLQKRLSWDDAVHIIIEIGAKGSLFSESKDPHEGIVDRASS